MSHAQDELDLRDLDFLYDQQATALTGGIAYNGDVGCYSPQPPYQKFFPDFQYYGYPPKYCSTPPVWIPKG